MDIEVTQKQLRQLRMICIAVASAGTIMCLVAIFVGQGNMETTTSVEDIKALRYAHLFLAMVSIFTSRIIGEKVLAGKMQQPGQQQSFFQRYQSSAIIQLAAIEGLTLFGAVIVMITPATVVANDPTFYLHLAPLGLLLLRAKQLYPTQDKLQMLARAYES